MRKSDLISTICERAKIDKNQADDALAGIIDHITNALARGDSVHLIGFGSFSVKARASRSGRNPQTGEVISIPASNQVHFKAGKAIKECVNK